MEATGAIGQPSYFGLFASQCILGLMGTAVHSWPKSATITVDYSARMSLFGGPYYSVAYFLYS